MEQRNPENYEYTREILDYDGYVLSVEYEDAYMLMNNDNIHNEEQVEVGRQIHFNIEDGLVSEALVEG
jgi:RNase P/RNase MRP subunit p30